MLLKYFLFLILNFFILFSNANNESCDLDDLKRSLENVNTRLDMLSERLSLTTNKVVTPEKTNKKSKSIFDIRSDSLPKHCASNPPPTSCAEATECTRTSGIYNITDHKYTNQTFTVYCDYYSYDGDWMYILTRKDGSEYFNRSWTDYVHGFGNVASEYWLGLDNLYALTNYYGPQELMVHIENFDGVKKFARYDNFVIGNAKENYTLKSLGCIDNDKSTINCAKREKGGFWYNSCGHANFSYLRGSVSGKDDHLYWKTFGDFYYSHKTMIVISILI